MIEIPKVSIRHHRLIVSVFGLYSRDGDQALPVSALIDLLGDLGYDAPGVRSSVSRLKAKGVLGSFRDEKVAKYKLSESVSDVFQEGDERIFAATPPEADDPWILAIFSVPESMRNRRHQLRTTLSGIGFGCVTSGVWIAPAPVLGTAQRRLTAAGLDRFVNFFHGDYLTDAPMSENVAQWWDLEALGEELKEFLRLYGDAADQWAQHIGEEAQSALHTPQLQRDAFRYYLPMLTIWRQFPYRVPYLPKEHFPSNWTGTLAREAFMSAHHLLSPLAAAHAHRIIDRANPESRVKEFVG